MILKSKWLEDIVKNEPCIQVEIVCYKNGGRRMQWCSGSFERRSDAMKSILYLITGLSACITLLYLNNPILILVAIIACGILILDNVGSPIPKKILQFLSKKKLDNSDNTKD